MTFIGKTFPRYEGAQKASGLYAYTGDIVLPRMLYAKLKRSERPHALLRQVDASRARQSPGVAAVLTGESVGATFGVYINDEPILARGKVRYVGEPLAAVVAASPEAAEEALEKITVEYEDLEPVFDPVAAAQPGAPLIHPDLHTYTISPIFKSRPHTNICSFVTIEKGVLQRGFDASDEILEDVYFSQMVAHTPLETHVCIAQVDTAGRVTLWDSIQSPFLVRRELAMTLGLPLNRVRIIVPGVGGGFGGKSYTRIEPLTAVLAFHANNRPVKLELSRREEFEMTVHKEPARVTLKTGVTRDGRILAREVTAYYDAGAYAEGSPLVLRNACFTAVGPYNIEHVSIKGYCVYTNNLISGPMRGFGTPQFTWAYESQMDAIAARLKIDPLEMRLKNCLQEGHETPSGEVLKGVGIEQTLREAARAIDYEAYKPQEGYGLGIACCHKLSFSPATASAVVRMDEDGSVQINCATVEFGQGSNNTLIQIAAETLGVPFHKISIARPDTDYSPYDQSSTASRSTFTMGNAVIAACEELKSQFKTIAAKCFGLPEESLECTLGCVKPIGSHECGLPFEDLIQRHFEPRKASLVGKGIYTSKAELENVATGKTPRASAFWMYGTQIAVVKVDRETGQYEVVKVVSAYDLGRTINALGAQTQVEGGVIQGMGTVTSEQMLLENGRLLNPSFRDYLIPTMLDAPEVIPVLVETMHEEGPFGAKGHGELVLNPTAPAVANAIFQATGVRINDLPITAEKLYWALRAQGKDRHHAE